MLHVLLGGGVKKNVKLRAAWINDNLLCGLWLLSLPLQALILHHPPCLSSLLWSPKTFAIVRSCDLFLSLLMYYLCAMTLPPRTDSLVMGTAVLGPPMLVWVQGWSCISRACFPIILQSKHLPSLETPISPRYSLVSLTAWPSGHFWVQPAHWPGREVVVPESVLV